MPGTCKKRRSAQFNFKLLAIGLPICISINCLGQDKIERKELLTANTGGGIIKKVDVREISLQAGQKAPYHQHPCPVVGYIVSGSVLFQVEGDTLRTLKAGDAFFEPSKTPIIHFDNASKTETLKFIAYYLINEEKELIEMLPPKPQQ